MNDWGKFYVGLASLTLFALAWDFWKKGGGR